MEAVTIETGGRQARFDPRGLVELDERVPRVAEIEGDRASFDAHDLTTRQINLELRRLLYEEGVHDVTVRNPGARHSLGAGILTRPSAPVNENLPHAAIHGLTGMPCEDGG